MEKKKKKYNWRKSLIVNQGTRVVFRKKLRAKGKEEMGKRDWTGLLRDIFILYRGHSNISCNVFLNK